MADVFASVKDVDCGSYELLSKPARAALDKLPVVGVDALDFGQGDCNAIVAKEGTDRRPVVLCDVGGGKGPTGGATHPWHDDWKITTAAPDVLLEPAIIQSHWDSDHYSTAVFAWRKLTLGDEERHVPTTKKLEALYDHCRWLVRRQRNGPSNTDFVRAVKSMVCWPEGLEGHSFQISPNTYVRVEPCTGENSAKSDRNLCGLAVRLVRTSKPDHTEDAKVTADIAEQAILPGDAPYKLFASAEAKWADAKVTILFAHHHGSHTHKDEGAVPKAHGKPSIAYTFGLKKDGRRCYGHPHADAVEMYEKKGWGPKGERIHCPSGTKPFKTWPPKDDENGEPAGRGHRSLDLETPDARAALSQAPSAPAKAPASAAPPPRVYLHRKAKE